MESLASISYPSNDILISPQLLYEFIKSQKNDKSEDTFMLTKLNYQRDSIHFIIDVMLSHRTEEDAIYTAHPQYTYNARRGLSFLFTNNANPTIIRKGLMKFYDIVPSMLQEEMPTFGKNSKDYSKEYILYGLAQCITSKMPITIYRLRKANGENAQISYSSSLNCWVVGSKNYAILVRDMQDINYYLNLPHKVRQQKKMAIEIAELWLTMVSQIQDIEQFKKEIDGRTLIGEYVGNQGHLHVIEYTDKTIMFYAVVDNNSNYTCQDPCRAIQLFEKYKLPKVTYQLIGSYSKWCDLKESILAQMSEISYAKMKTEGEGVILYFTDGSNTVSLCKLKTLDYIIVREIREFAAIYSKQLAEKQNAENDIIEGIKNKIALLTYKHIIELSIVKNNKLSESDALKSIGYEEYINTARKMLQYIKENNVTGKEIISHFTTLLSKCL